MPKVYDKGNKIVYPEGCRELSEDLSKEELLKRLKALARAFQDMGQDENNDYKELSVYLATEFFMDHGNKDVRLLTACCIADIFRIFAPDAPFTDSEHLKEIFLFLTKQLKGLEDPDLHSFKRYFYLLENLAWVKSFNICIELEDNQEIFCDLFRLMFSIVNQKHSPKVLNFMLDMMSPLLSEAEVVSQDLLDIILLRIIDPIKSNNRIAYNLSRDLIKRTANALEPYIQTFFNNALMLGKTSESEVSGKLFDLIYELNMIAPSVLLAVLPQLEFKLKSSDEKERLKVTKLLSKMFSDPDSQLAQQNKPLWVCFLGRFKDIDIFVRRQCVQISQEFIINHPDLISDVTECLRERGHDTDENVRMDVIQAIVSAGKRNFLMVTNDLLTCVKERTLDKKYKLRKEALSGLGAIYKRCSMRDDLNQDERDRIEWVKDKILHAYYQTTVDDRILVERILNMSLVPFSLPPADRMKRLLTVYASVDENAVKALQELLKTQMQIRVVLRSLCELHTRSEREDVSTVIQNRIWTLARNLPEPQKAQEHVRKFSSMLRSDMRVRQTTLNLTSPDCKCSNAEEYVKEILKKMGTASPTNYLYTSVKTLLERVAPVMIDKHAIEALVTYLDDAINGIQEINDEIPDVTSKGMKLLLVLSHVYPGAFQTEETYFKLISFVKNEDDSISDTVLQVFTNVGQQMEKSFPQVYSSLLPILQKMAKIGTPKQAKHSVMCINRICINKHAIFRQIFVHSRKHLDMESPNFQTALVAIGLMTQLCPDEFSDTVKTTISTFIVKDLLMKDKGQSRPSNDSWYSDHLVSDETQAKMLALKLMVRWLLGIRSNDSNSGTSTLRLLYTIIVHEGDLMEKGVINKAEMARLRLRAGCCMLKLAQEHVYESCMSLEWFQALSLLIVDPCYQVRYRFAQKLHKGLLTLRLPLQYLSIFCLVASDPLKERRVHIKTCLVANISKRREYLRTNSAANAKMFSVLPDYVLPYAIHLLSHDPDLRDHHDVEALKAIKDCLWFIMEPLISKNENYSYSFYRKLIENIKQTKDKQEPHSAMVNAKLYAVCDLALGLVMTKSTAFVLKDFPADPVLPAKLFTSPDNTYSNTKIYLPDELRIAPHKAKKQNTSFIPNAASAAVNAAGPTTTTTSTTKTAQVISVKKAGAITVSTGSSLPHSPASSPTSPQQSPPLVTSRGRGGKRKASQEEWEGSASDGSQGSCEVKRGKGRGKRAVSPSAQAIGKKRDSSSSQTSSSATRTSAASTKPSSAQQGKITDFVSRSSLSPRNKENNPSANTNTAHKQINSKAATNKLTHNLNKEQTRSLSSSGRPSPRKRGASDDSSSVETSPVKKKTKQAEPEKPVEVRRTVGRGAKSKPVAAAPTRRGSRKTEDESEASESEESGRVSPRKNTPATRRASRKEESESDADSVKSSPRKTVTVKRGNKTKEIIPSPTSSPAKSSSASSTPRATRQQPAKLLTNTRTNVRRAGGRMLNGTSDGETTPDSRRSTQSTQPSPTKSRPGRPPKSSEPDVSAQRKSGRKTVTKKR